MSAESDPPGEPFFLIVADLETKRFCVEGPMTDDGPWNRAASRARDNDRHVRCGPKSGLFYAKVRKTTRALLAA